MRRSDRKIQRDIQKRIKAGVQPFDVWYSEHEEKITSCIGTEQTEDEELGTAKIKRRFPMAARIACVAIAVLTIAIAILILLQHNNSVVENKPFGEDQVQNITLEEKELERVFDQLPQLGNLENVSGIRSVYRKDKSTVMVSVNGEIETKNDFYIVDMRMLFNDNFVFLDKWEYSELTQAITVGETSIEYDSFGTDSFGLYVYLAVTEVENTTIYWKVSCIEGRFDEWLQIMFE